MAMAMAMAFRYFLLFLVIPSSHLIPPFSKITSIVAATHSFSFNPPCPPGFVAFGDSLTDTGNLLQLVPSRTVSGNPPYGRTFFHHPTGRFSDGRLLVDFIAQAFGYPFLHPYFDSIGADFRHGANFAVAGATANLAADTPFTLPLTVNEFTLFRSEAVLRQSVSTIPKASLFRDALYIVGEIGENDLRYAIQNLNQSTGLVENIIVPQAVAAIAGSAEKLYQEGARNFLFVGILAQGCSAFTITVFGRNASNELDSLGCLKSFNRLVQVFNSHLRLAVHQLRWKFPDAAIVFADYYNASLEIFSNPLKYGFDPELKLVACCGIGGKYNYDPQRPCGMATVKVCSDPRVYINWDGVHFTDAFYGSIARMFLRGQFLDPPINLFSKCSLTPI